MSQGELVACNSIKFLRGGRLLYIQNCALVRVLLHEGMVQVWPESDVVQVPDMEPAVFEQLLEAITLEKWQPTSRLQAKEVYVAAHKYMVTRVLDCCLEFIWPKTSGRCYMYLDVLDLATQLHLVYLLEAVMFHIRGEGTNRFRLMQIEDISQASLIEIVREPCVMASELGMFDAAMRWATARCYDSNLPETGANIRAQLGEVLHHIRFLAMTEAQLNCWVFKSGVLTPLEITTILGVKNGSSTLSQLMKLSSLSPFRLNRVY